MGMNLFRLQARHERARRVGQSTKSGRERGHLHRAVSSPNSLQGTP
jgi:hypothetical protein